MSPASTMIRCAAAWIYWILLVHTNLAMTTASTGTSLEFDCRADCFNDDRNAITSGELSCSELQRMHDCYDDHIDQCSDFTKSLFLFPVQRQLSSKCATTTMATTTIATTTIATTEAPPPYVCPVFADQGSDPVTQEVRTDLAADSSCRIPSSELQHCSLFTYSQLRTFGAYGDKIQTCSLPGKWQLFHHAGLVVDVEGTRASAGDRLNRTVISWVRVSYEPNEACNPNRITYTVTKERDLPTSFDLPHPSSSLPPDSALELHTSEDGEVVSLLAPWINTTIIIRRYRGWLSVTLQVSGRLAFEGEGLCTGCPTHQLIDSLQHTREVESNCRSQHFQALVKCFVEVDDQGLYETRNLSYADACIFDYITSSHAHLFAMYNRISHDARTLPNVGFVPRPPTRPPPISIWTREETTPTGYVQESTTEIRRDTPSSDDTPTNHTPSHDDTPTNHTPSHDDTPTNHTPLSNDSLPIVSSSLSSSPPHHWWWLLGVTAVMHYIQQHMH